MCFSAEASFISGSVIAVAGIASLRNVKSSRQALFASIPLLFSIQQFTEGIIWLSLKDPNMISYQNRFTTIFLVIAQIIWPILVPLSIGLLEKSETRKKFFFLLTLLGVGISVWISYCLLNYSYKASIVGNHIFYQLDFPKALFMLGGVSYFIATVFPAFFSTEKGMPILGTLILASYIVTALFFERYVISVWCFFAALMSVVIYFISRKNFKSPFSIIEQQKK